MAELFEFLGYIIYGIFTFIVYVFEAIMWFIFWIGPMIPWGTVFHFLGVAALSVLLISFVIGMFHLAFDGGCGAVILIIAFLALIIWGLNYLGWIEPIWEWIVDFYTLCLNTYDTSSFIETYILYT